MEAFSDGVISVAITLLALDLLLPGPGHGPLLNQLGDRWLSFVAYLISFLTVGIIWVNHHQLVQHIAAVDRVVLFLNLLLLLFIVLIPFATATMAAYLRQGGRDAQVAVALYATVFEAMSISFAALSGWTLRERRAHRLAPVAMRLGAWLRFSIGTLLYLIAIGLAFLSAPASLALVALIAVYYLLDQLPPLEHRQEAVEEHRR